MAATLHHAAAANEASTYILSMRVTIWATIVYSDSPSPTMFNTSQRLQQSFSCPAFWSRPSSLRMNESICKFMNESQLWRVQSSACPCVQKQPLNSAVNNWKLFPRHVCEIKLTALKIRVLQRFSCFSAFLMSAVLQVSLYSSDEVKGAEISAGAPLSSPQVSPLRFLQASLQILETKAGLPRSPLDPLSLFISPPVSWVPEQML